MRLSREELVLFAIGGGLGFVIDAGVVQALVSFAGVNPYLARILSFLLAATATWWWNRNRTFAHRGSGRGLWLEWLHWMGLMAGGALINYVVYVFCLKFIPAWRPWPVLPTAVGSVVAAGINFLSARLLLFKHSGS